MQPEHCWANFKFSSPLLSCLLHRLEVYVKKVSCLHQHLLSVVGQTAHHVFHNHRWGYRVTIMTITEQTACSLSYNKRSCYSTTMIIVHLFSMCVITCKPDCPVAVHIVYPTKIFSYLSVVGQTAHSVFHNHRCGYRVIIITVTQQTVQVLSYNQRLCYRTPMMIAFVYTCSLLSSSSLF
jgi:hypothetical protein